ncbi:MAG: response regulator transcription factor [Chitinophagaceae bacterium]|nr:MAG: response regulator transcription factor [Chitinophagaceae bacterium]
MSLKTIIVEDEALSRLYLGNLLLQYCHGVEIVASVATEQEAVTAINTHRPGLLLLDIELQHGSGFEVLNRITEPYPYIVFTTAFDDRVLNAIRFSGIDFLEKPIDMEALATLTNRLSEQPVIPAQPSLPYLRETLANNYQPQHLAVNTEEGTRYLKITDIIRMEAIDQQKMLCVLRGLAPVTIVANISDMNGLLEPQFFFRVQLTHLVNLANVTGWKNADLVLVNGEHIPVSAKKEQQVRALLAGR